MNEHTRDILLTELSFTTSRSSGPGGQHVNKTESRVELYWNIAVSTALTDTQKSILKNRLKRRFSEDGIMRLVCQESRSQIKNRELVIQRFLDLVEKNMIAPVKRIPTRPSRAAAERRLKEKKIRGELKRGRGRLED